MHSGLKSYKYRQQFLNNLRYKNLRYIANNNSLERTISDPNTALLKLKSFEGKIKFSEDVAKDLEGVSTEYVFFAEDHFDFDAKEANLERMIREAENQNADVVAGKGHKFYQPITEFLRPWFLTWIFQNDFFDQVF